MEIKRYRRHYCERNHRSYRALAKCLWPRAAWISGEGPFASLAWCRALTVALYSTRAEAEMAKACIDAGACGGFCTRRHEIIEISLDAKSE